MVSSNDMRRSKIVLGNVYGAIDEMTGALSKGYGLFYKAALEFPVKVSSPNGRSMGSIMRRKVVDPTDPDRVVRMINRMRRRDYGVKEEVDLSEIRIASGESLIKGDLNGPKVTFTRAGRTTVPGIGDEAQFNPWHEAADLYGKRVLRYGPTAYRSILAPSNVIQDSRSLSVEDAEEVVAKIKGGRALRDSMALSSPINGKEHVAIHSIHPDSRDLRVFQLPGKAFARRIKFL